MTRSTVAFGVLLTGAVIGSLIWLRALNATTPSAASIPKHVGCGEVQSAFARRQSYEWVTLSAPVWRTLSDSVGQYYHQRFILRCPSGQTVLIENDVSIGRRVPVHPGDMVTVHGQYIWNALGGLVHYTHHGAGAQSGWIALRGTVYSIIGVGRMLIYQK